MKITLSNGARWYPSHGYLRYLGIVLALIWVVLGCATVTAIYILFAWCRELDWFNVAPVGGAIYQVTQWSTLLLGLCFQLAVVLIGGLCAITGIQHTVGSPRVTKLLRALLSLRSVLHAGGALGLLFLMLLTIKHSDLSPIIATLAFSIGIAPAAVLLVGPSRSLIAALIESSKTPLFPDDAVDGLPEHRVKDLYDQLGAKWERPDLVALIQKLPLYAAAARSRATTYRYAGPTMVMIGGGFIIISIVRFFSTPAPGFWQTLSIVLSVGTALAGHRLVHRASLFDEAADQYAEAAIEAAR